MRTTCQLSNWLSPSNGSTKIKISTFLYSRHQPTFDFATATTGMESESAVRLERRKTLLQLERTVEQLQVPKIDLSELNSFNIAAHPMTLTGNPDSRPSFFARSLSLPEPDDGLPERK
ncbi:hypothetical protein BDV35DRAFT_392826 [Aspergillus flavus]|nr:hypothetical protein BDV35DRAFT_392826 [Aspergillus flavus]